MIFAFNVARLAVRGLATVHLTATEVSKTYTLKQVLVIVNIMILVLFI